MHKPKVLAIVGPTASGKTGLSLMLAKEFNGEIISADARQVYRGLDIGTEKISPKEMRGIPHHLIDVANPKKVFTAHDFQRLGEKAVADIVARGHTPILVGGTGFYLDALLSGVTLPEIPPNQSLRKALEKKSVEELVRILKKLDPKRASTIDHKNPRRLIRAIEIAKTIGRVPPLQPRTEKYAVLWIGLLPQKNHEDVLAARLKNTLKKGLVREVSQLRKQGLSRKRLMELGLEYRIALRYQNSLLSKKEMEEEMLKELRKYAKRQMTWFKKNKNIVWFTSPTSPKILHEVKKFLKSSGKG